ncbi:response regulator [Anaerolineales bacterium HSG24]|nr:response regulator [Anaerolineales bacterium HSG24]
MESSNTPTKILVVDDEPKLQLLIQQLFRQRVRQKEFTFIFAQDGEEALEILKSDPSIDVLLTDINMPNMDGLTLLAHLQELKPTINPALIAVIISAYADMENIRKAMNVGSFDFLTKPIDMEDLKITVENSVEHTLILKKAIEQKRLAEEALQKANEELELRIEERTAELRNAKETAEAANQIKSTFLANMSHELRSPLNVILGFTQMMRRGENLAQEHQENLNVITRSGEHLLTLINDVLDMSKIEAGRTVLNRTDFDLYRLLDDVEDMFRFKANDKELKLYSKRSSDLPRYIHTDELKLRQVLINLLSNAIKFTQKGHIVIKISSDNKDSDDKGEQLETNSRLSVMIEDSGYGIASDEMGRLFKAFVQTKIGENAQTGTGLGLPISQKFVKMMDGTITVQSPAMGIVTPPPQGGPGSTFTFDIGVKVVEHDDIVEKNQSRQVVALEANQPEYRILVVDDKWTNRQFLIHLLEPFGFFLKEARNGQEAIEIWEEWHPHLIWMDIRMPIMDGYEATRQIKARMEETSHNPRTVIIALTAGVLKEDKSSVIEAGCDDIVYKPFQEANVFELMDKHIGVKYIYQKENASTSRTYTDLSDPAYIRSRMSTLPPDLLATLEQVVVRIDMELIAETIEKVSEHDHVLAKQLTKLADDFEYEKILSLIRTEK